MHAGIHYEILIKRIFELKLNIMKHILILTILVLFNSVTSPLFALEDNFIEDYLERLENSRKYLILVAETMPEDKYNFNTTPEAMSFAENLMHIGYAIDWHSQSLLGGRESRDWNTDTIFKVANKSKEEMIATINKTFDETIKLIQQFDTTQFDDELDYFGLNRSKRQIFFLLTDHVTHHRAQMLVYLRLNGLYPPRYVLFQ
jgi:uncharacterized damage-inducible protein DinB